MSVTCDQADESTGVLNEGFSEAQVVEESAAEEEAKVLNGVATRILPPTLAPDSPETRRPSTVTFNERTQIIEITRKKK